MLSKKSLQDLTKQVSRFCKKNMPAILTGLGIAGGITTTVMACVETPKALAKIEEAKTTKNKLNFWDYITATAPVYWPAAATGALSIACVIGAQAVNMKRQAAIIAAYQVSESNFKEYRDKVKATIGTKKEEAVEEKAAVAKAEKAGAPNNIYMTGSGDYLCYDSISGRWFRSNQNVIYKAVNEVNMKLIRDNEVTLNEFYDLIGLPYIDMGEYLGWNTYTYGGELEMSTPTSMANASEPYMVLNYEAMPLISMGGDC